MNESQKIVFKMALEKLAPLKARLKIVSGAALGFHKDREGNPVENEYTGWAKESSQMSNEIDESLRLLNIIYQETFKP